MSYPSYLCVHKVFEHQVASAPDALALVCGERVMTYQELNERANRLAWQLIAEGVGPEIPVGICMNRSFEMIIGILGILKAGGAYVPLEPSYPEERLEFMVRDSGLKLVLVQAGSSLQLSLRNTTFFPVGLTEVDSLSTQNPSTNVTPENLVYVVYTSGSTGAPKGVEVVHRAVIRLVFDVDYVTLDRHQVLLHLSSLSFDASTFEIWGALLHGARCVLYSLDLPVLKELKETITKHGVNTLWLTSSLFNTIIDEAPSTLVSVSQLLIGGEALSVKHVRKALVLLPATQIINGYGPTENTTFTCCYRIPKNLDENIRSVPIGVPISHTSVCILDDQGTPVTPGQPGELYVGGDGVARGYLNRAELTRQKFIRNPFDSQSSSRLYRTGDLVRLLKDGNLEFLGRADDQVKLRGFRIELGEVESTIRVHPSVKDGVVRVQLNGPREEKSLVAYIVPTNRESFSVDILREYLKEQLPHYMIPSFFMVMDAFPITSGSKIDRRALPNPWESHRTSFRPVDSARTDLERLIAEVWRDALHCDGIGIEDNFFEVGGQSLTAIRVHKNLQEVLEREIPITVLFQYPTIRTLAAHLSSSVPNATMSSAQKRGQRQAEALAQRRSTAMTRKTP